MVGALLLELKQPLQTDDLIFMGPRIESDDTRIRLLEAAEDVFAEKGYEAATTREICNRAGVRNVGAVNYYFQGKERLYAEAVKYAMRTCAHGAPFPDWPPGTPPADKLRDFIRTMMARMLEIPKEASMTLMTREMTRSLRRHSPWRRSSRTSGRWPMSWSASSTSCSRTSRSNGGFWSASASWASACTTGRTGPSARCSSAADCCRSSRPTSWPNTSRSSR